MYYSVTLSMESVTLHEKLALISMDNVDHGMHEKWNQVSMDIVYLYKQIIFSE